MRGLWYIVTMVSAVAAVLGLTILVLRFAEASRWPAPAAVPAVVVPDPTRPLDDLAGLRLLDAADQASEGDLGGGTSGLGPPPREVRRTWRALREPLEALDDAFASEGLSIPAQGASGPVVNESGLLLLGEAALLRAWEQAAANPTRGVHAFAALVHGWTNVAAADVPIAVSHTSVLLAAEALDELQELLDLRGQASLHGHAAKALGAPPTGPLGTARATLRACVRTEHQLLQLTTLDGMSALPGRVLPTQAAIALYNVQRAQAWHRGRCRRVTEAAAADRIPTAPALPRMLPRDTFLQAGRATHHPVARRAIDAYSHPEYAPLAQELVLRAEWGGRAASWAGRAHKALRGKPPESLGELVPRFLPEEPNDPFGKGPLQLTGDAVESRGQGRVVVNGQVQALRWPLSPR